MVDNVLMNSVTPYIDDSANGASRCTFTFQKMQNTHMDP